MTDMLPRDFSQLRAGGKVYCSTVSCTESIRRAESRQQGSTPTRTETAEVNGFPFHTPVPRADETPLPAPKATVGSCELV